MGTVTQPRSVNPAELGLELAKNKLNRNGHFVVKLFQGEGFERLSSAFRLTFQKVKFRKPKASRATSSEIYAVCSGIR